MYKRLKDKYGVNPVGEDAKKYKWYLYPDVSDKIVKIVKRKISADELPLVPVRQPLHQYETIPA